MRSRSCSASLLAMCLGSFLLFISPTNLIAYEVIIDADADPATFNDIVMGPTEVVAAIFIAFEPHEMNLPPAKVEFTLQWECSGLGGICIESHGTVIILDDSPTQSIFTNVEIGTCSAPVCECASRLAISADLARAPSFWWHPIVTLRLSRRGHERIGDVGCEPKTYPANTFKTEHSTFILSEDTPPETRSCIYYVGNTPRTIGWVDWVGSAVDVVGYGNHAYAMTPTVGLNVINIANPTAPRIVAEYVPEHEQYASVEALDAVVWGGHLYAGFLNDKLEAIDINNPSVPRRVASVALPLPRGLAFKGEHVYVAGGRESPGLTIVDVSDPDSMRVVGATSTPGEAVAIAVAGDYAFVADGSSGLQVIAIKDPTSPSIVGNLDTPGNAVDVALAGDYAYVADGGFGLQVIDVSNPAAPGIVGVLGTPDRAHGVALSGAHAYVAQGAAGFDIIDVSDPVMPSRVQTVPTADDAVGITLLGKHVYVATGIRGVQIFPRQCSAAPILWAQPPASSVVPAVSVGDTIAIDSLRIHNLGTTPLQVAEIALPFPAMSVQPSPPFVVEAFEKVDLRLTVPGVQEGLLGGNVIIESNDPVQPRTAVWLRVRVAGLGVETTTTPPSPVPLGREVTVLALPQNGAQVDRAILFFRPRGGITGFFSDVMTTWHDGLRGSIPPQLIIEGVGVEYYVQTENSGFVANSPPGAPETTASIDVQSPTRLVPVAPNLVQVGQDATLRVALETGALFLQGNLHYRPGGTQPFNSVPLEIGGLIPIPEATIPGDSIGLYGVDYWIEVQSATATLTSPRERPEESPHTIPVRVSSFAEGESHRGERYRLLSVPVDFGVSPPGIQSILQDQSEFGAYDPTRWRAYRYASEQGSYAEYSPADTLFRLRPGRAYWLISRLDHRVDTAPIEGSSTPTGREYPIALSPGWNQFGNPFAFPVAWDSVRHGVSVGDLIAYDPGTGDYDDLPPTCLLPFEGYFIRNSSALAETLWVRPIQSVGCLEQAHRLASKTSHRPHFDGPDSWRIRLWARTEQARDGLNVVGVVPGALEGRDALDRADPPPPPGAWVRVAVANLDWSDDPGLYAVDLRPPGLDGYSYEVEVTSRTTGEAVELEFIASQPLPTGFVVRLFDHETGGTVDLQGNEDRPHATGISSTTERAPEGAPRWQATILSHGPNRPYRLLLLVGSDDFTRRESQDLTEIPSRTRMDQNTPNPFNATTRIRFGLHEPESVTMELFDVAGRRVTTLLKQRHMSAGYHSVIWKGTDARGDRVASGIYVYRLRAGSTILTRRLALIQ